MTYPPAYPQSSSQIVEPAPRLNPLAVVSLIASILLVSVIGIITGHVALAQIRRSGARGRGLALAGVIIGYVGFVMLLITAFLWVAVVPIVLNQLSATRDTAVQADITNAKVAVVSELVANPGTLPELDSLTTFTPYPDTVLTLSGDANAFCIEGYSQANAQTGAAIHYAASDQSATVKGTCAGGTLVPGG